MAELNAARRAAAALLEHKEVIARSVTGLLYAERPWLLDRYGERGREKCLQDMRYNLEHLIPAVELEAPDMFSRYATWCDQLLRARGVQTAELVRTMEIMRADVAARLPADQARAVAGCLDEGIRVLAEPEAA